MDIMIVSDTPLDPLANNIAVVFVDFEMWYHFF